jgi:hypothetical protein
MAQQPYLNILRSYSKFLQVVEKTSILIAITACQGIGMMERWVIKTEKIIYKLFFFLQTHFSSIPVFHHSNCERSELSLAFYDPVLLFCLLK